MTGRGKYDRAQSVSERQEQRREHVLDRATDVFAKRGFAGTRVDDIVEAAGISRRTLYEELGSIEQILEAVYERAVRIAFTSILERLMPVQDPIARIHAGVAAWYEMVAANASAAIVVFDVYRHAGAAQAAKYELNTTRYTMLLFEALNSAHAAGRIARRPDEVSVYALVKGAEAVSTRALHRGEHARLPEIAPTIAKLIIDAFRNGEDR
jgi:AcrR family transcriptional regulator